MMPSTLASGPDPRRTPLGTGGRHAAFWRKSSGRWLLHAELYVPLFCEGAGCK